MYHKFKIIGACLALLLLVFLPRQVIAATQFTNEFWMSTVPSTNSGGYGAGTLEDPWDGSTQARFDYVLKNLFPPNATLHLLAGTYSTLGSAYQGDWNVQTGQRILGSGIDNTIVRLATNTPDNTWVFACRPAAGTNMEIADLTCDANYTSGTNTVHGVALAGSKNAVRRVKVINLHYKSPHPQQSESWGIVIGSHWSANQPSEGNVIEECEVSQIHGDGTSGIVMIGKPAGAPTYGVVRNNRVLFNKRHQAIGISNCLLEGNYVEGAGVGVYVDTADGQTNSIIANNTFKDVTFGVYSRVYRNNMIVANNTITLSTNTSAQVGIFFQVESAEAVFTNMMIIGNTVDYDGAPPSPPNSYSVQFNQVTGGHLTENIFNPGLGVLFTNSTGINIYNNFDPRGNFLTNMNQLEPPNGLTRTTLNAASYTANYGDHYIGVIKTGTTVNLDLPSAVGHAGKEFIVAKEISNGNTVNINAISPDTINGATKVSFSGSYASRTVISDGTNWFAH
jgi:hypothetical protein